MLSFLPLDPKECLKMKIEGYNWYDTNNLLGKKISKKAWYDDFTWKISDNLATYINYCIHNKKSLLYNQNKIK